MHDYLITGGRGFIGRNLTNALDTSGKSYRVIDSDVFGYPRDTCSDVAIMMPAIEAEVLVHLASETDVRKSIKSPRVTIERNCTGLINCLTLLKHEVVGRMVFTSSASSELSLSPYLASKAACECICMAYKESYSLDVSVLKLSNVYGPCSRHKESVVAKFMRNILDHEPLTVFGKGNQRRDFIYVSDVVDAIISGKSGYVTTGMLTKIGELAWMIQKISADILGWAPRIDHEQPVKGEVLSPQPGRTDISAKVDLEDGLVRTFKWFEREYENSRPKSK
jgi:UDP-glucose 4-epimerase